MATVSNIHMTAVLAGTVEKAVVNINVKEEKMDIVKPKNSEHEIKEITEAFFRGEELEFCTLLGNWKVRDNKGFPSFDAAEYRIKKEIPEGYEEVDYREIKAGDIIATRKVPGVLVVAPVTAEIISGRFSILKKKAPKFEVGQIWEGKLDDRYTLQITKIEGNLIHHLDSEDGKFVGSDVVSADSCQWDAYQLKEV